MTVDDKTNKVMLVYKCVVYALVNDYTFTYLLTNMLLLKANVKLACCSLLPNNSITQFEKNCQIILI